MNKASWPELRRISDSIKGLDDIGEIYEVAETLVRYLEGFSPSMLSFWVPHFFSGLAVALFYFLLPSMSQLDGIYKLSFPLIVLVAVSWLLLDLVRIRELKRLLSNCYKNAALLHNGIALNESFHLASGYKEKINEFNRGDRINKFTELRDFESEGFTGQAFSFVWSKVRDVVNPASGKVEEKITYYTRQGVILPLNNSGAECLAKNVMLTTSKPKSVLPENYRDSSISKCFNATAKNRLEASKLLKPAVVVSLLEYAEKLTSLNVELTDQYLCISAKEEYLLEPAKRTVYRQYPQHIKEGIELPVFDSVVGLAKMIFKYTDSNFRR